MKFTDLELASPIDKLLAKHNFVTPTEIQEKVIPLAIQGNDILWTAQTGSGKTLAFSLPILHNMYTKRKEEWSEEWKQTRIIKTLIITPTRELAIQIWDTLKPYCTNVNFTHTVVNGWVNQFHQVKALEKWVDILIATPGRLLDLISQWYINISHVEHFVIDEADKMLEMGFMVDVRKVIKWVKDQQTYFFSATMPKEVRELAWSILKNPIHIKINEDTLATETIEQKLYRINQWSKRQLLQQIVKRPDLDTIIVFANTKDQTEIIHDYILALNIKCDIIHRWRTQNWRQKALDALKKWYIKVLIATDIASRWLDVSNLSCVVNYDIPNESETYVHRIWRTGRAGKDWLAISFSTEDDIGKVKAIETLIWEKIHVEENDSYKNEIIPKSKYKLTTTEFKQVKAKQKRHYWTKREDKYRWWSYKKDWWKKIWKTSWKNNSKEDVKKIYKKKRT